MVQKQRRPLVTEDSKEGLLLVNHRRKTSLHLAQPLLLSLVLPLVATLGQGDHYLAPLVDAHLVLLLAQEPLGLQLQQLDPLLPLPRLRSALHPPLHLEPLWRCRTLLPLRLLMRLLVVVLSAHPGQVLLWGGLLDWVQAAGHSEQAQAALSGRVPQRAVVRQQVEVHLEAMLQAASLAHEELDKLLAQSWQALLAHRRGVLLNSGLL